MRLAGVGVAAVLTVYPLSVAAVVAGFSLAGCSTAERTSRKDERGSDRGPGRAFLLSNAGRYAIIARG